MDNLQDILDEMENEKRWYELKGVELTLLDAQNVLDYIDNGMTKEEAIDCVLTGIRECLDEGLDEE